MNIPLISFIHTPTFSVIFCSYFLNFKIGKNAYDLLLDLYLHHMFSVSRVESKPLKRQSIVADGEENKRSKRHKKVSYTLLEFLNVKLSCKF